MLKSIDILLGVTVVMLIVSVVVTALTQAILYLRNSRGRELQVAIADLLGQVAPDFSRTCREHIAKQVLLHPLVRESENRLSSAVHREDLIKLLLQLASSEQGEHVLQDDHRRSLMSVLQRDGVKDPAQVLSNVRSMTLQLEMMNPELSNSARANIALLQEANSPFLAKVHAWFDQSIDRSVDRFTASARVVTFACGFAVALALQLDTAALVNRLSSDDAFRAALVQKAIDIEAKSADAAALQSARAEIKSLAEISALDIPADPDTWLRRWKEGNPFSKVLGILLSTVLLSFGAPFWYNALKNLLKLRSVVASRDDKDRNDRQTIATAPPTATAAATAVPLASVQDNLRGERGFLGTLG